MSVDKNPALTTIRNFFVSNIKFNNTTPADSELNYSYPNYYFHSEFDLDELISKMNSTNIDGDLIDDAFHKLAENTSKKSYILPSISDCNSLLLIIMLKSIINNNISKKKENDIYNYSLDILSIGDRLRETSEWLETSRGKLAALFKTHYLATLSGTLSETSDRYRRIKNSLDKKLDDLISKTSTPSPIASANAESELTQKVDIGKSTESSKFHFDNPATTQNSDIHTVDSDSKVLDVVSVSHDNIHNGHFQKSFKERAKDFFSNLKENIVNILNSVANSIVNFVRTKIITNLPNIVKQHISEAPITPHTPVASPNSQNNETSTETNRG